MKPCHTPGGIRSVCLAFAWARPEAGSCLVGQHEHRQLKVCCYGSVSLKLLVGLSHNCL